MMKGQTRIALIPACEPETMLLCLLQKLRETGLEVIVVDDGSGSDFSDIFKQAAELAVVLTHSENYIARILLM